MAKGIKRQGDAEAIERVQNMLRRKYGDSHHYLVCDMRPYTIEEIIKLYLEFYTPMRKFHLSGCDSVQ